MEGSAKRKVETICMTVLGLAVAGLMVFPIIWLGFSSFKPSSELFAYPLHLFPQAPTGESYISVVADGFFNYVKNSLFLAVVGTGDHCCDQCHVRLCSCHLPQGDPLCE